MRSATAGLLGVFLAGSAIASGPFWANPFNQKLLQLRQADQYGALRRAINDSDERCGRLTKAFYQGPYGNLGFWSARCVPGGDYGVFTGPDGSVQVRSCSDMKALKLPLCAKFD